MYHSTLGLRVIKKKQKTWEESAEDADACHEHNLPKERELFIDNLLVRIQFIIMVIRWTGLAPWEFEFPFPGSLTSTCPRPIGSPLSSLELSDTQVYEP